jgi:hypothetical protein
MPNKKENVDSVKKKIVVAGDMSFDWFEVLASPESRENEENLECVNWLNYPQVNRMVKMGGAPLLAEFIVQTTDAQVVFPQIDDVEGIPSENFIHSYTTLEKFPRAQGKTIKKDAVYRIKAFKGYSGPEDSKVAFIPFTDDDPNADIVVLHDEGNGFRNDQSVWPKVLKGGNKPLVLFRMSYPLFEGKLWETIRKKHAARTILFLDADDLRERGVKISRRLSWERTAKDFVWQMASNPELLGLNSFAFVVVRFGMEGAILHTRRGGRVKSQLFFDPIFGEDGFSEEYPGRMCGVDAAFAASLTAELMKKALDGMEPGTRQGLLSSRKLWQLGFGQNYLQLKYPVPEIFKYSSEDKKSIADVIIPNPTVTEPSDPDYWCILDDLCLSGLEQVAFNFVIQGKDPALDRIPVGQFRYLRSYDRSEIESFRSIKNLISEYLDSPGIGRPLSIAVFGAPGSGKSFGVTEVAESVAPGRLSKLEFNLSQIHSTDDLVAAFHIVRDVALTGKIPIVFFDEFDSEFDGKLGWLKYFLAPMQDGQFRDGEAIHPIGRAIFVFAGGTCSTFTQFAKEKGDEEFKGAKGPDFVSRLRGYVDIKGPNPVSDDDRLFVVRRAIFLRFLLQKNAKNIFDVKKRCRIDPGVLRAMIKVPYFKHGVRSMQAILEMSLLSGRRRFEQAALPSPKQLRLHVDEEIFSRLVVRDVLLGSAREVIAQTIHEYYRKNNEGKRKDNDPAMADWDNLQEDLRESNRQQADHIPVKLKAIRCDFAPVVGREPKLLTLKKKEIEIMAEIEHDRFVAERFSQGWSAGKRNATKKTSPYLVGWDKIPENIKDYDRNTVRLIPELLAKAGFEIYRLKK